MLRGRGYTTTCTSLAAKTAAAKPLALIQAGASNPLVILEVVCRALVNNTSFQIEGRLRKGNAIGSASEDGDAAVTSVVNPMDINGTAASFTLFGEIDVEPTYQTAQQYLVGRRPMPSLSGWKLGGLDYFLHGHEWIFVDKSEFWVVDVMNASFASTQFQVEMVVVEVAL